MNFSSLLGFRGFLGILVVAFSCALFQQPVQAQVIGFARSDTGLATTATATSGSTLTLSIFVDIGREVSTRGGLFNIRFDPDALEFNDYILNLDVVGDAAAPLRAGLTQVPLDDEADTGLLRRASIGSFEPIDFTGRVAEVTFTVLKTGQTTVTLEPNNEHASFLQAGTLATVAPVSLSEINIEASEPPPAGDDAVVPIPYATWLLALAIVYCGTRKIRAGQMPSQRSEFVGATRFSPRNA